MVNRIGGGSAEIGTLNAVQDFMGPIGVVTVKLHPPGRSPGLFAVMGVGEERNIVPVTDRVTPWRVGELSGNLEADNPTLMSLLESGSWPAERLSDFLSRNPTVDPVETFTRCVHYIEKHIDFPDKSYGRIVALWLMGTYIHRLFEAFPYLAITGPRGSGKTRLLEVLGGLAFNPLFTANISPAAMFRVIEAMCPTLLLDEAEGLSESGSSFDLRLIIQSGYRPGPTAIRASGDGYTIQTWNLYCPKAIANIHGLESTLADRAIPVVMWKTRGIQGRLRLDRKAPDWGEIRAQLYSFALTNHERVAAMYASSADESLFRQAGRIGELWNPLLAIAAFLEENGATDLVLTVQEAQEQHSQDVAGSASDPWEVALAVALLDLVPSGSALLTPTQIADQMIKRLGSGEAEPTANNVGRLMRRLKLGHDRRTGVKRQYLVFAKRVVDFLKRTGG